MTGLQTREPERFVPGSIDGVAFRALDVRDDERGWLVELYRADELPPEIHPVMAYVSESLPGAVRGPHHHLEQSDHFAFVGPGDFTLYLWDIRIGSPTWGRRMTVRVGESNKQAVIVPPGVVHAYKNSGPVSARVFNAANRLYAGPGRQRPVDEVRHEGRRQSPYRMDD